MRFPFQSYQEKLDQLCKSSILSLLLLLFIFYIFKLSFMRSPLDCSMVVFKITLDSLEGGHYVGFLFALLMHVDFISVQEVAGVSLFKYMKNHTPVNSISLYKVGFSGLFITRTCNIMSSTSI